MSRNTAARLKALPKSGAGGPGGPGSTIYRVDAFTIDTDNYEVRRSDQAVSIELTRAETVRRVPFRRKQDQGRYTLGLRKAGLPA